MVGFRCFIFGIFFSFFLCLSRQPGDIIITSVPTTALSTFQKKESLNTLALAQNLDINRITESIKHFKEPNLGLAQKSFSPNFIFYKNSLFDKCLTNVTPAKSLLRALIFPFHSFT